jgi:tetratricopeptide (TPR) repeat protein
MRFSRSLRRKCAAILCVFLPAAVSLAQTPDWIFPELSWKEPDFQARFLGRYGVNAYTEPQMDVENFNLYERVLTLMENKPAAIADLERGLAELQSAGVEASGTLYFLLASLNDEVGRKPEAIAHYISAIRAHPSFLRAYANLGFTLMENNEKDKALPVLLKAVELGANEAQVHGLIGYIYLQKELHASALTAFQWAMVFNPQNNQWRRGLLQSLIGLERFSDALGVAEEIVAFERSQPAAWTNLAGLLMRLECPDDAIVHLQTAHALGGASYDSQTTLARLFFNKGIYERGGEAILAAGALAQTKEQLDELLSPSLQLGRDARHALAEQLLAGLQTRAGEIPCELDPVPVGLIRGAALTDRGDFRAAEDILSPLAHATPENGDLQLALARLHAKSGRSTEAEARFEIAQTHPDLAYTAFFEHAQLVLRRGDVARALELLREAHALKAGPTLAEHIRRLEAYAR